MGLRPAGRVWLVALVAAMVAGAPLLQAAHMVSVAHAVCPSHGEMIHVADTGTTPVTDTESVGANAPAEDHHDVCGVAGLLSPVTPASTPGPFASSPSTREPSPHVAVTPDRPIRILDLAPKTSPPTPRAPS